jgi:hypothetical protein
MSFPFFIHKRDFIRKRIALNGAKILILPKNQAKLGTKLSFQAFACISFDFQTYFCS